MTSAFVTSWGAFFLCVAEDLAWHDHLHGDLISDLLGQLWQFDYTHVHVSISLLMLEKP